MFSFINGGLTGLPGIPISPFMPGGPYGPCVSTQPEGNVTYYINIVISSKQRYKKNYNILTGGPTDPAGPLSP